MFLDLGVYFQFTSKDEKHKPRKGNNSFGQGRVMAFCDILVLLAWLVSHFKGITTRENTTVDIAIFYNASDRYLANILQKAEAKFLASRREKNQLGEFLNVYINLRRFNEAGITGSQTGLNNSLFDMRNISSQIQGSIFVDINSNSLFLSSIFEQSSISAVGIFQSRGQRRTQESPGGFSRLALPSIKHYAQVISEVMKKMERRSLCLILSADSESKELADAMSLLAKVEKWPIKEILWLINVTVSLELEVKSVIAKQSDVVVVHSRDTDNELLFQTIKSLGINTTETLWILTDITEHGISRIEWLPLGMIKISARKPESYRDQSLYANAVCDALLIYQAAFERAHAPDRYTENPESDCFLGEHGKASDIQDLANIYLKETFIEGESSLFLEPSVHGRFQTTFEIWNLRPNRNGAKHWTLVGLRTPTGLALDTFMAPNGSTLMAPPVPVTHVMRVPVNEYSPWVQVQEPRLDSKGISYCLGRGQLCYKFENSSRDTKTTLCCFGVSIDFLSMIQNEFGFQSEIYFTPDGNYGDFDEDTQAWNGIVQEVISGKADFAIDISMNTLREKYLDFAHPFVHLALNVLVLKDLQVNDEIQWSSWLEPFQYQLWLSIVGIINLILIVIWWIDRKSPYGHYRQLDSGDDGFTILDSMTYVWGVALGKDIGAEKTPHSSSARFVSTFYAFFALIVVNTYCANLMAFLVQENFELPINGIRDAKIRHSSLKPPNGFKLGIQQDSQEETYFKFHSEDIFREIYKVNLKLNFVKNFAEGVEKLKKREIHGLVGDYLSLSQVAYKDPNCLLSLAGPNFFNFGLGLALPKASPWLDDINEAVLKNQENETIKTIQERWFNKKSCDSKPFTELGVINFSGLFMTLVLVLCFCACAVFVEFSIVIMLIKCGNRLGVLGKSIKRFAFNVKKGEEDQLNMQYSFLLRRPQKGSFDVTTWPETVDSFQELGFHNDSFFKSLEQVSHYDTHCTPNEKGFRTKNTGSTPHEQSAATLNHQGAAHYQQRVQENGEIANERELVKDSRYTNGQYRSRTKSFKKNGSMSTKL